MADELDIDRLHDALHSTSRGAGRTTACCHVVCGAIELAEPGDRIVIYVSNQQRIFDIKTPLISAFRKHMLDYQWVRYDEAYVRNVYDPHRAPVIVSFAVNGNRLIGSKVVAWAQAEVWHFMEEDNEKEADARCYQLVRENMKFNYGLARGKNREWEL